MVPTVVKSVDVAHMPKGTTRYIAWQAMNVPVRANPVPSWCFTPILSSCDRNVGLSVTSDSNAWLGIYTSSKYQSAYKGSCSYKLFQHACHLFILSFLYPYLRRTHSKLPMSAFYTTGLPIRKLEEIRITSVQGHPDLTEQTNHCGRNIALIHGPNLLRAVVSKGE